MDKRAAAIAANKAQGTMLRRRYNEAIEAQFLRDLRELGLEFVATVEAELQRRMEAIPRDDDSPKVHVDAVILAMAQWAMNRVALDAIDDELKTE